MKQEAKKIKQVEKEEKSVDMKEQYERKMQELNSYYNERIELLLKQIESNV